MAATPQKRNKSWPLESPKTKIAPPPALPREEWDFESVEEIDLPACYLWEYWREKCNRDSSIADALNGLRGEVRADDDAIRRHDQSELALQRLMLAKSQDLPEAYAESLKVYGKFNLYEWSSVNPLSTEMDGLANISEEYFPRRAFQSLEPLLKEIIRGKTAPKNRQGQLPPFEEISSHPTGGPTQRLQEVEAVSFQINWNYTDELIQEAFHEWIRLSRAGRTASITRGLGPGKSITKTLLKDLKALGALRLLTHYGTSSSASRALEKANRSVLADKSEWSKAKKHAESLLQGFMILSD
jgi:hypothetical protein